MKNGSHRQKNDLIKELLNYWCSEGEDASYYRGGGIMSAPTTMRHWSSAEIAKPSGELCGHRQWKFPYKVCNESQGHTGDHCCTTQCGTQVVRVWWSRNELETV